MHTPTRRDGLKLALGAMAALPLATPFAAKAADGGIRPLGGAGDALGEGPIWSAQTGRLMWINISGQTIYGLRLKDGDLKTWKTPSPVGFIAERRTPDARGRMIAGLKDGIYYFNPDTSAFTLAVRPETREDTRINDGKVDAKGRLWAGTMDLKWKEKICGFYRIDPDLSVTMVDGPYLCTNGPTFSPDQKTLWHTETFDKTVFAFDMAEDGTLSRKRPFVVFSGDWGSPDGMTTDAQGGVWIAHYGGGRVSRFKPDGTLDFHITMPVSQITSLVFGGEKLDHLYVTSASQFLPDDAPDRALSGAIFEVSPALLRGHTGLATNAFAG